jgi:hypothetical protein
MAAYGLLGAEPAEPDDRTKRLWRRGRQLGADVANDFAARYGDDQVVIEKAIPWPKNDLPIGELHTDVFVKPEKMAVEVKSSTSPASILDDAITQLGGEIFFDQDAEVGCLAIVDPTGFRDTELLPVLMTDELQERVESIAAQVVIASRGGEMPARVCQKPSDGRGKFCPFVDICFSDWQRPDPINLDDDVATLAIQFKVAQDDERAARAVVDEKEKRRKELGQQLSEWELEPGVEYAGGGVRVKRTAFPDSLKMSYTKASKAGVFTSPIWTPNHEALIAPFVNASGGHDRWAVSIIGPVTVGDGSEDFGDVAPWDDTDLERDPTDLLGGTN